MTAAALAHAPPAERCAVCSAHLRQRHVGRPRRFCSGACRAKAHRNRYILRLARKLEAIAEKMENAAMNETLANAFVRASQQLTDNMLAQLQNEDPEMAEKVVQAVQRGEALVISCDFSASACIELVTRSDYNTVRRVCSIPMQMPAMH